MATYAHTSFAQAKDRLASLLGDPAKRFFTDQELGLWIVEALRCWGLYAQYWRDTASITTTSGQAFYSIATAQLPATGEFVQSLAVTDRQLINEMTFHLIEPFISAWPAGWQGTEMFTLEEITELLARARDQFLAITGCVLEQVPRLVSAGNRRVELEERTTRVVRGSFQDTVSTTKYPIWHSDQIQLQGSSSSTWLPSVDRPKQMATVYTPILALDVWPTPSVDGTLNLLAARSGTALSPTAVEASLGIPDDAAHIVKYRVLGDLLGGDGLARAPAMAKYCEQRWVEGLTAVDTYQSVLWAEVNGARRKVGPLAPHDRTYPTWETTPGPPRYIMQPSWNLVALSPPPDATYIITVEIVRKAIIPIADTDFLQIGREHMEAIYDYAQHVASFKMQGQEFEATMPLWDSFKAAALDYAAQQAAQSPLRRDARLLPRLERAQRPYRRPTVEQEAREEELT